MSSPYAEAHKNPAGPGDARPTALQIIKDEKAENTLIGKFIVITGTSSGIGIETARALSLTGAKLFLTARNLEKAKKALEGILKPGQVELVQMDNVSLASVRAAAKEILEKSNNQVNILVNNAGIMALPKLEHTQDGFEMQFGVNHLSHFLFFELLKPALLASATPELSSRVVSVSSSAHHLVSKINDTGDYNFEKTPYDEWVSYGQSKTANIYFANEIERRYGSKGLHATSLHPGMIPTALSQHMDPAITANMGKDEKLMAVMKSIEQGAATTVWAAIGKEWENKGGEFLSNCQKTTRGNDLHEILGEGYAGHAYDPVAEARLWKDSLKMVGLPAEE